MDKQTQNLKTILSQTLLELKQNEKNIYKSLENGSLSPKMIVDQTLKKIRNDDTNTGGFNNTNEGQPGAGSIVDKRLRDEYEKLNLDKYFETKLNELERLNNGNQTTAINDVNTLKDQIMKDLGNMSNNLTLV